MSYVEWQRFVKIQSLCLLLAILILASHTSLPINREQHIDWVYAVVVSILALLAISMPKLDQIRRKLLIITIFFNSMLTLAVGVFFFVR